MEGNRESDAQLLRRMQLGDDKALGLLMERYAGYVYRVIANVLLQSGTASDAEELTSDTFYAAPRRYHFVPESEIISGSHRPKHRKEPSSEKTGAAHGFGHHASV